MSNLYERETSKTVAEVVAALPAACTANKFGVVGTIDMAAKMREKNLEFAHDTVVVEVCSPAVAKRVLDANLDISAVLPCRVSVYRAAGASVTRVVAIRPAVLAGIFPADDAIAAAIGEVDGAMAAILDAVSQ